MKKIKLTLPAMLLIAIFLFGAEKLDFSKKRNYYFGEGEYGAMSFDLKNFETYDYQSEIRKPFIMKKINNSGLIEVIFDSRTLNGEELIDGKSFTSTIGFTKKNIGKKENLILSAVYKPELRFLVHDSLYADFVKLKFTPESMTDTVKVNALKNISRVEIDNPNQVVTLNSGSALSFQKGLNELEIKLAKKGNFEEEVLLYRNTNEGKISILYLVITSSGFKNDAPSTEVPEDTAGVTAIDTAAADTSIQVNLNSDMPAQSESADSGSSQSSGFSMISMIIISVMAVIIILLIFLLSASKKGGLYEKYQTFFEDVATLLKVNTKGVNIDKCIEEIMMTLLEKYEFNPNQAEQTTVEKKKILKKPANLKSPGINSQKTGTGEEPSMDIDLDFGKSETSGSEPVVKDISLNKKNPSTGEKKISRGFDFLEEDN